METLLVDEKIAEVFLPHIAELYAEKQVELRGCQETRRILGTTVKPATEEDWYTEYLGRFLQLKWLAVLMKQLTISTNMVRIIPMQL